jgi:L-asparagine oxygenase
MNISIQPHASIEWKNTLHTLNADKYLFDEDLIEESANIAHHYLNINESHKNELKTGKGFIEFSNIPIDDQIGNPPCNATRPYDKGFISELALIGVTKACGLTPFSYLEEKNGALVHEITPTDIKQSKSVSSEGTVEFDFHTDGAYLSRSIRPHSLSLLCLVDQKRTGTNLISLDDIISRLTHVHKEILFQSRFVHVAPETFKVKHKYMTNSVLDLVDGHYEIKAALHSITALDQEAQNALNELKQLTKTIHSTKHWKSGDLLIFNNLRCMHGRGEIVGKRWLQRCYGTYTFDQSTIVKLNP